jgi:hypothetical protein
MKLKASTAFDRWIRSNSAAIAEDSSDQFKHLIATTSLLLKMIEGNPKGVAGVTAEYVAETMKKLKAEIEKRGMKPPDIQMPKIKVVRPR